MPAGHGIQCCGGPQKGRDLNFPIVSLPDRAVARKIKRLPANTCPGAEPPLKRRHQYLIKQVDGNPGGV